MRTYLFIYLVLVTSGAAAQFVVAGRITDGGTYDPLPAATVYFDGTTVGTFTGEDGRFTLSPERISLPTELVVSHLGYRTQRARITGPTGNLSITLLPDAHLITEVRVEDTNQREKNVKEFTERYLGTDPWGKRASMDGIEGLRFARNYTRATMHNAHLIARRHEIPRLRNAEWSLDGKSLRFDQEADLLVTTTGPLTLHLPDLGYTLYVDLHRFYAAYATGIQSHAGSYYFRPYEGENGVPRSRHRRNRATAYYNSTKHFLAALFHGRLDEEGFTTFRRDSTGRFAPIDLTAYLRELPDGNKSLDGLTDENIRILYYGDGRGRPLPPQKRKRKQPVPSVLQVAGARAILRPDGTTGDAPLYFSGWMGSRGVAWMLPAGYAPE